MIQRLKGFTPWLALFLLIFGALWLFAAPDLESARETEETYVRKLTLLARLQALPEEEKAIKQQLEKLGDQAAERMLYAGDANAVQLRIQRDLRQLASRDHMTIRSTRAMARYRQTGLLQKVSVQLNFVTTHDHLVSFLKNIETAEPILRVSRLSVRVQRPSTETTPADLMVMVEISGFQKSDMGGPA